MPGLDPGIHDFLAALIAGRVRFVGRVSRRRNPPFLCLSGGLRFAHPPYGARAGTRRAMIRYDDHAEFQLTRRGIDKASVEETIRNPDATETEGHRRSYLKCLPGRHVMLRVVVPANDPEFVITAYFDRTKPCA